MLDAILFPSSYFDRKTVDEEFAYEYDAAAACGLYHQLILFSYDDWFTRGILTLDTIPVHPIQAVYRGWMMHPQQYRTFYRELEKNHIRLLTTPEEYERFHLFPNIYDKIREDTPKIMLFPSGKSIDLKMVQKAFPRFLVKDYVKSVKGTDFPPFFDNQITQEEFDRWMNDFYKFRGNLFEGGICIKEFVDLKQYGKCKNEYRVFYINGKIATVGRNSHQPDDAPSPPMEFIRKYQQLDSPFYTIDYAELQDGTWTIVEAGDGSVSGIPDNQNACDFFQKLYYSFNDKKFDGK